LALVFGQQPIARAEGRGVVTAAMKRLGKGDELPRYAGQQT